MKEIYLYEAKLNENNNNLFFGARLLGGEQLLGTYQQQDDNIMVTKKNDKINLRRFIENTDKYNYIAELQPIKLSDKEQLMLQDRIKEIISRNISFDVLGDGNSIQINNNAIQLLPNDKFEYMSNLKKRNSQRTFHDLLYIDLLEKQLEELKRQIIPKEERITIHK